MSHAAEQKFWGCPELIEVLISFLDSRSILELVHAHKPALKVLHDRKSVWNKFCPSANNLAFRKKKEAWEAEAMGEVRVLCNILKMLDNPAGHLLKVSSSRGTG